MTNIQNAPIEALKRSYSMRVLRYRLRQGSGGNGHWGAGSVRGLEQRRSVVRLFRA
ncbi:MAG: hydantoinase B/oxoprolinase family protein [Microthrixaceae bacterium]|nr:hydantoinase B/oxoprolinase family protein [Microthrixaceae bacterium]